MDSYYQVNVDLVNYSHYEFGLQYAQQISYMVSDFEERIDSFVNANLEVCKQIDPSLNFATVRDRAFDIYSNLPIEYVAELVGMEQVFSYDVDVLGDGRLSRHELLVYQLFADVLRPSRCSASAVYGDTSSTGSTIVGRNLDWYDFPNREANEIHSVTVINNGSKSIASFGMLGLLCAGSAVSDDHVFAAVLDIDTGDPYPNTDGKRSYTMDLRYALENQTSLDGVAGFVSTKDYAYNHLVFLADPTTAKVEEEDIDSPGRGLRTATSQLIDGLSWDIPDAIATVNSFLLPANAPTHFDAPSNVNRWNSFVDLYTEYTSRGTMGVEEMMQICGYAGPGDSGKGARGALFRSTDGFPTLQSIIMDMSSLETYAFFEPAGEPQRFPNYVKVFSGNPFAD